MIEIYPDRATHSPNSKYTIRIRRVYSDTQSFRLFLPPWKRGSISRIRLINERHKLAGLDGFPRETKRSVDLEEEFAGSRRFFARRKQRSSWFFPWIVACPQPPPVSPFSPRFFRSWLQPPPPPPRTRNTIYTGFLRIPFNSARSISRGRVNGGDRGGK